LFIRKIPKAIKKEGGEIENVGATSKDLEDYFSRFG